MVEINTNMEAEIYSLR